jgi:asparagine synthase (glutamine-hydrolysing)
MCGICGELTFGAPVDPAAIRAMRDRLAHRGPDDESLYVSPGGGAALGFRRLRIIDLSPNALQPLANEDGSVRLVFNGEIYNFRELRADLVRRGHRFRSQGDAETIVHLYEEKGASCIDDLDGMFALAIWDERARRLTLARDRAGKKPLFLYQDAARLAFASEVKAFFAHPGIELDVDRQAVPYYFMHGYVPGPQTFYRKVRHLEPATVLTVEADGRTDARRYWQLTFPDPAAAPPVTRADAIRGVRERMTNAVERRLVSDVPLGAFLSGGVDSTIVVGLMSRLMSEPVKTFSIGFEGDPAYDETSYARLVATRFGTDHTEFRVSPSAVDLIDTLIWHHDGPFGDSSAIPTYLVSRLTREHVTVVLTGDGGDELFAGYLRFYAAVVAERTPWLLSRTLSGVLRAFPTPVNDRHRLARAKRFARFMQLPLYERLASWSGLFYDDVEALCRPELFEAPLDRLRYVHADRQSVAAQSPLQKVLHANFNSYLPDDLLVKTDRCTMANALEGRAPFLDRELTEYAAALPDGFKLSRGRTKAILRDAFADLLPPDVARRGKMGFGVPLGTWFRGELRDYVRDLLLAPDAKHRAFLSTPYVERVLRRHQAGQENLGHQLWALLTFERWLRLLPEWRSRRGAPVMSPPAATVS